MCELQGPPLPSASCWLGTTPKLPGQGIWPVAQGMEGGHWGMSSLPDRLLSHRFEQAFVSSLIYSWDGEYFWTALQDLNSTGSFRWLSGDEVMYTHWNRDQPGEPRLRGTRSAPSDFPWGSQEAIGACPLTGPSPRASQ